MHAVGSLAVAAAVECGGVDDGIRSGEERGRAWIYTTDGDGRLVVFESQRNSFSLEGVVHFGCLTVVCGDDFESDNE